MWSAAACRRFDVSGCATMPKAAASRRTPHGQVAGRYRWFHTHGLQAGFHICLNRPRIKKLCRFEKTAMITGNIQPLGEHP